MPLTARLYIVADINLWELSKKSVEITYSGRLLRTHIEYTRKLFYGYALDHGLDVQLTMDSQLARLIKVIDMSENIDFYYTLASPACRPVMMFAKALGIKINLKPLDILKGEHMTPEFLNINPQHTLPTLVEDSFILWESRAIMKYLADVYDKDKIFFPQEPKEEAVVNQRLYFDATVLFPRLSEYLMGVILHGQPPDAGKRLRYEEALKFLDGFLAKSMWVAGQQMTIADFCVIANIATAEAIGIELESCTHLTAWYERAKEAMELYGYEEINQEGADMLGKVFNSKLKQ